MKPAAAVVLLVVLAIAPTAFGQRAGRIGSSTPSVASAVSAIEARYRQVMTYQADFEQKTWIKADGTTATYRGRVTFASPSKILTLAAPDEIELAYSQPASLRIVFQGTTWTACTSPSASGQPKLPSDPSDLLVAIAHLGTLGAFASAFSPFEVFGGDEMKFSGGYVLVGVRQSGGAVFGKALFYIDAATVDVRRSMVIDRQGNRDRFDFSNEAFNIGVRHARFTCNTSSTTLP